MAKHCSKNKHHREACASSNDDRSEDEHTKRVLALRLETPAEYPNPLRLNG
ncbi:hypothetical protein [Chamaesiphon minutus]|uniref:hypothetical protein n=1 Tax=Chamaesiphon minutus TaxID=1173032 RepID=UPI0012FAE2E2|nr:hypothetical protein [Chamaesiphon minutus]